MYETWESLETACFSCHNCPLGETRTKLVFGVGSRRAGVRLSGEGPGENEDLQGEPFVGRGGKLLDQMCIRDRHSMANVAPMFSSAFPLWRRAR